MNASTTENGEDIRPLSSAELDGVNGGLGFLVGVALGLGLGFASGVILEETKPFSGTLQGTLHR